MFEVMTIADWIGSIGVTLLLGAFSLNLAGRLSRSTSLYAAMNTVGAGLAASASWIIGYLPFVILEGVWCLVSAIAFSRAFRSTENA